MICAAAAGVPHRRARPSVVHEARARTTVPVFLLVTPLMPFRSSFVFAGLVLVASAAKLVADYPVASHRHLADPAAMVHDGRVYIYCSNDDDSPLEGGYD